MTSRHHDYEPAEATVDWWHLATILIVAAMLGAGMVCMTVGFAHAAELPRIQRVTGWSVTLHFNHLDDDQATKGHQRLSGYVDTRGECEAIRKATVARLPGGRLACDFTDELQLAPR